MELAQKIDAVLDGVKNQETVVDAVKTELADLRDAFAGLKAANDEVVPEVKQTAEEVLTKFFNDVKSAPKHATELIHEGKAFNVTENDSAGAFVVESFAAQILTRLIEGHAVVKHFGRENGTTDYQRRVEIDGTSAGWVGENTAVDASGNWARTGAPRYEFIKCTHGEAYAKEGITTRALVDPSFDAQSRLMGAMQKKLARVVSDGLMNAAGQESVQPKGFMQYFDAVEGIKPVETRKVDHFKVMTADIATDEQLLAALHGMTFELVTGYVAGSRFYMARDMFQRVAMLKDGLGRPLMAPSFDKAAAGRLFGFDIVVDATMGADKPVIFGDVGEAFKIINIPSAVSFLANPYKVDGQIEYTITARIGTIVNDNEAVVALMPTVAKKAK